MRFFKQLICILATGYIFLFFSELLFWARVRPDDSLPNWISTWAVYSLMAYVFLTLLAHFRVRSIWALFLTGAAFGWLTEGLVVQTTYESLPLSISFTGLAWHALITVWLGWYALPKALHSGFRSVLFVAAATGLFFGFWGITWWLEPDGGVSTPLEFTKYVFIASLLLMLAYWVYDRTIPDHFKLNRVIEIAVAVLLLAYFVFVSIPAAPWAALILPVLLGGLYFALRHNRNSESQPALLEQHIKPFPIWRYAALLALPLTATVFYSAAYALNLQWHTNWVVYLITTPAGFVLLISSFAKVLRKKAVPPPLV